jgi:hypothetical protein
VDQARAEYEALAAKETAELAEKERKKQELDAEWRRRTLVVETLGRDLVSPGSFRPGQAGRRPGGRQEVSRRPDVSPSASSGRETILATRRGLKKLVNRWAFTWNLKDDVLGQINRIADDTDRPLGEALVLLDWSLFEGRVYPHESDQAHLDRLTHWSEALAEYRDQLAGDIDTLETRYRRWLGIWEQFKARTSPDGQARWEAFIAETRQATQRRIDQLNQEIADREAQLRSAGGQP